jgi:hypothetical protein
MAIQIIQMMAVKQSIEPFRNSNIAQIPMGSASSTPHRIIHDSNNKRRRGLTLGTNEEFKFRGEILASQSLIQLIKSGKGRCDALFRKRHGLLLGLTAKVAVQQPGGVTGELVSRLRINEKGPLHSFNVPLD